MIKAYLLQLSTGLTTFLLQSVDSVCNSLSRYVKHSRIVMNFITEPVKDSYFSKVTLPNYDHLPFRSQWNSVPVHKNLAIYSLETIERVSNFEVHEDDVWVITYPKCGTTWTQEMCWLLMNGMDFDQAKKVDLENRSPCLELFVENIKKVEEMKKPRLIKSHEPMALLPKSLWKKNPKIIFVVRNPRDALLSHFHHYIYFLGKSFVEEKESFIENRMKYGGFWEQVLSFYQLKDKENVMFLSYEEMKADLKSVVLKMSRFLDKTITDTELDKLVDHLGFDNMKRNPACSHKIDLEGIMKKRNLKEEDMIEK